MWNVVYVSSRHMSIAHTCPSVRLIDRHLLFCPFSERPSIIGHAAPRHSIAREISILSENTTCDYRAIERMFVCLYAGPPCFCINPPPGAHGDDKSFIVQSTPRRCLWCVYVCVCDGVSMSKRSPSIRACTKCEAYTLFIDKTCFYRAKH